MTLKQPLSPLAQYKWLTITVNNTYKNNEKYSDVIMYIQDPVHIPLGMTLNKEDIDNIIEMLQNVSSKMK